ncbi:MAG TPA: hypothetical protein VNO14_00070 [Blastocatellia bacterium]|nr:hypothetical protein [Blastocatellia bacterium]
MARRKKRVRITVESDQVYVMRRPVGNLRALCAECGDMVHMIMPEEAMALAGVSSREIYRLVEAGRVHFLETADGFLLICLDSLPARGISSDPA